jgi:hypothetical protein
LFDPTPKAVAATEWCSASAGRLRAAHTPPLRHRQNAAGDLVIPLERGEIVTLPRLWGFALEELTEARAVLRRPDGLAAEIALQAGTAVVEHVGYPGPFVSAA